MPVSFAENIRRQQELDEQAALRNEAIRDHLMEACDEAEQKAFEALARYKFQMFGYWAAIWVHLNRIGDFKRPNPFKALVNQARIQTVGGIQTRP